MRALIINDEIRSRRSEELEQVLESSLHPTIAFEKVSVCAWQSPKLCELCSTPLGNQAFEIALLVTDQGRIERAREIIRRLSEKWRHLPILAISERCAPEEILDLIKSGAVDFITPPLRSANVIPRVRRWSPGPPPETCDDLSKRLRTTLAMQGIIGKSPAFLQAVNMVPKVADCDVVVLIAGETGTGKELIARAIHYLSPRAGKPFIPVNCGALPEDLVENELFGHERGAYTGAAGPQKGLVAEAEGGTLFLDEVDSLTISAQAKVLRLLEEGEFRPLGTGKVRHADVRIVAAANSNLERAVSEGHMREDFYYRLNVIPLTLPPLRERTEDIPLLAERFLGKAAQEYGRHAKTFSPAAVEKLLGYHWPGNVRELHHEVERAVVLSHDVIIQPELVLKRLKEPSPATESFKEAKAKAVEQFEIGFIEKSLLLTHGNIAKAARLAGKHPRAYWELVRKHDIDAERFR